MAEEKHNQRKTAILYINENIDELPIHDRKEVLQMLICNMDIKKIVEKGSGTQIKYKDMSDELLVSIQNFVKKRIDSMGTIV